MKISGARISSSPDLAMAPVRKRGFPRAILGTHQFEQQVWALYKALPTCLAPFLRTNTNRISVHVLWEIGRFPQGRCDLSNSCRCCEYLGSINSCQQRHGTLQISLKREDRPRARTGTTQFIAADNGYLLGGKKIPGSAFIDNLNDRCKSPSRWPKVNYFCCTRCKPSDHVSGRAVLSDIPR